MLSLIAGTTAGCLLVIIGDLLQGTLRSFTSCRYQDAKTMTDVNMVKYEQADVCITYGSVTLLALFGHGALQTIYEHCHNVGIACLLAATAGCVLVTVSKLIQLWTPMRHAGFAMQMRITNTVENWQTYPVRSAIESTFWVGCLIGTYETVGSFTFALQVATFAGIVICLWSELFWNRFLESDVPRVLDETPAVAPACIFAYGMLALVMTIFSQAHHWATAVLLSTIAGLLFSAIGLLCTRWSPTAQAGAVIYGRVSETAQNWAEYPLRSFSEITLWLVATWASFAATKNFCIATGAGALTGILAVLGNHELGWGSEIRAGPMERCQAPGISSGTTEGSVCKASVKTPIKHSLATRERQQFTWAEVAKHCTEDDAWIVINGNVYDVTDWAPQHPGGSIIYKYAGADASDQFAAFHMPRVAARLPKFLIGNVSTPESADDTRNYPGEVSGATLEYRALRQKLWQEGWFEPRVSFYVAKTFVWLGLILASAVLVMATPQEYFWLRTVGAGVLLGLGWQQAAFMSHDTAHYCVHKPASGGGINWLAWWVGCSIFGGSLTMWNEEHSMHHAITLRPQEDPQFNYLPLFLISMKELDVPGTRLDVFTKFLVSIQHITFLPLVLLIGRFNFYLISAIFALKRSLLGPTRFARIGGFADVCGMTLFWLWHCSLICCLEGWQARLAFVLTSNWACGILHVQLLMSHLMTETFTAEEERAEQFFAFQMKTTRNIDVAWYDKWFHGGLEYQIEHHLFPQLPRHNLEKVQPFVKEICDRHGITYRSQPCSQAFLDIMRDFRKLAFAILTVELG